MTKIRSLCADLLEMLQYLNHLNHDDLDIQRKIKVLSYRSSLIFHKNIYIIID